MQEFDRLNEFENAVLEQLPYIGESSTFGCELDFVHKDTREMLVDPIWDTLRDNNCFNLIVRQCFTEAEHKGQLKSKVRAIRVPCNTTDRILPHAFSHNTEVRHVQVEAGIRIIGEAAWRSCLRLQVVQLPSAESACKIMEFFAEVMHSEPFWLRGASSSGLRLLKNAAP